MSGSAYTFIVGFKRQVQREQYISFLLPLQYTCHCFICFLLFITFKITEGKHKANLFRLQNYYNFSKYASIFEEKNDVLLTSYKMAPFLLKRGRFCNLWITQVKNLCFITYFLWKYLVNSKKSSNFAPCFSWY